MILRGARKPAWKLFALCSLLFCVLSAVFPAGITVNVGSQEIADVISGLDSVAMAQAFANSSVYSSTSVSQRGYTQYERFAVTFGSTLGFQLPSDFSFANFTNSFLNIREPKIGVNPQLLNGQVGINASFLYPHLFLGLKFGAFNLNQSPGVLTDLDAYSFGLLGSYQFLPEYIWNDLARWQGLSMGVSLVWQHCGSRFFMDDAPDAKLQSGGAATVFDFSALAIKVAGDTVTLPVEVTTGMRLLRCINLALGLGIDFAFGSNSIAVEAEGTVDTGGDFYVSYSNASSPVAIQPKFTAGLGFTLGPVIIDIPFSYYFLTNGLSLGLTLGALW